jgi:hypothetical protein
LWLEGADLEANKKMLALSGAMCYKVPNLIKWSCLMDTKYSTFQAAAILGIEYVRLNEWLRGYFDPEQRAKGRGTRTKFSLNDLYRLKLFELLTKSGGVSRGMAKEICSKAAESGTDFSRGYVVTGKCVLTGYVALFLSDKPFDLNKNIKVTIDRTGKELRQLFPIQIVISRAVVKELVDSKLP